MRLPGLRGGDGTEPGDKDLVWIQSVVKRPDSHRCHLTGSKDYEYPLCHRVVMQAQAGLRG